MINVAIIEDDNDVALLTKKYLNDIESELKEPLFDISIFNSGEQFLKQNTTIYQLIFLDIQLPGINGMQAAKRIRDLNKESLIIFVTNMSQFAIKGYEVDATDFIVKPIVYYSFKAKVLRAYSLINSFNKDNVTFKVNGGGFYITAVKKIKYFDVQGHRLVLHGIDGDVEIHGSISQVEKLLEKYKFLRCNVCYLINPEFITRIDKNSVFIGSTELTISRPRKKAFMDDLSNYFISKSMFKGD